MKKLSQYFLFLTLILSLNSCSTLFDKDNTPAPTPLTEFKPEITVQSLWHSSTGAGPHSDYLKLSPAINNQVIFTASKNGSVAANDLQTGKSLWQVNIGEDISGGTAAYNGLVYVGTREGKVFALSQANGKIIWQANSSSEILAPVAGNQTITLAKTIDGHINAFSTTDGHSLWEHQQTEPTLILRGSSAPQITQDSAIVGFETGELVKLKLRNGEVQWQKSIAEPQGIFAIQRMIDIDADPIVVGNRVYAATYQGRIAALNLNTGEEFWNHVISSYSGITSDGNKVYVSDAESHLWAFNASNGVESWQQSKLAARVITGPALIKNYLVVGDAEGYLHWMSKEDGHFVARTFFHASGIAATPVVNGNALYVYSKDGHLAAYTVK